MNVAPVLGATMAVVLCAALAPRFFAVCDGRVARRRIEATDSPRSHTAPSPAADRTEGSMLQSVADHCRAAARRVAAGMPAGQALGITAHALAPTSAAWAVLARRLDEAVPLESALHGALEAADGDDETCLEMIHASTVDRHLSAARLDHVAQVLDETDALRHEIAVGAAHAVHTARMLTWLPVAVLCIASMASDSLQSSWDTPAVLVPVCIGGALNLAGRVVVSRAVARTARLAREDADSPARIADCLGASLAAGLTIDQACARLDAGAALPGSGDDTGIRVATACMVREGAPLEAALANLMSHPDTQPIAETARAVARDGLAGSHAAAQLGAHARSVRRVRTRTAVARLPSALAVPVTLLFLPAFVIGAVVPVVATGSQSLRPIAPAWSTHGGGE